MGEPSQTVSQREAIAQVIDRLRTEIPQLFAAVSKRIQVHELLAGSGGVGEVVIDRVIVGDASIGQVRLADATATLHSGSAFLEGVAMTMRLELSLEWHVDLGILFEDSGTENLGALEFALSVGNVLVPDLDNIQMSIPAATVGPSTLTVPPLGPLSLGASQFEGLRVEDTLLPVAGFVTNGLLLGDLSLSSLAVPGARSNQATIQRFQPSAPLTLPGAAVNGLNVPSTRVPDIRSGAIQLEAQAEPRSIGVDLGVLALTIAARPIVRMRVAAMHMTDVALAASVGSVAIENVRIPVDVRGVALRQLDLREVVMNQLTL